MHYHHEPFELRTKDRKRWKAAGWTEATAWFDKAMEITLETGRMKGWTVEQHFKYLRSITTDAYDEEDV